MATVHRITAVENNNTHLKKLKIFFQTLYIFSGIDFGFFETSNTIFWKLITFIHSIFLCGICTQIDQVQESIYIAFWVYLTLIHYISTVLCLILFKPTKKFSKLFTDLEAIDIKLEVKSGLLNLEIKLLLVSLFHIVLRVSAIIITIIFSADHPLEPVICGSLLLWLITCMLSVHISYAFVFYSVNYRLQKLNVVLRTATSGFSSMQHTYKSIVDLIEAYKTAFDPVFFTSLVASIPEVMLTIYYAVFQIRPGFSFGARFMRIEYFLVMESFLVTFAPAIYAGQLATQTDKIKCTLHEKLMEDIDTGKVGEIKRFIRYVEARSCRFRIYKVIPLDADLLGMVLSFCATYLIVIIQFTK